MPSSGFPVIQSKSSSSMSSNCGRPGLHRRHLFRRVFPRFFLPRRRCRISASQFLHLSTTRLETFIALAVADTLSPSSWRRSITRSLKSKVYDLRPLPIFLVKQKLQLFTMMKQKMSDVNLCACACEWIFSVVKCMKKRIFSHIGACAFMRVTTVIGPCSKS